jgi:prepilin-type processing-associated H-X9-DG protein
LGTTDKNAARRRRACWFFLGTTAFLGAAILLGATAGFLLRLREATRNERCENNLRRIYQAFAEYRDANGAFPPAFTTDVEGRKLHSWRVLILPFLGEEELFAQIRLDEPWDSEWNSQFHSQTPNLFKCASTPEKLGDKSCRCAVSVVLDAEASGVETAFRTDGRPVAAEEIRDGAANTILCVERKSPVCWMAPDVELTVARVLEENEKPVRERVDFGCWHERGVNVLMFDGSTRFLSEKIDGGVLRLLLGIADSPVLTESSEAIETGEGETPEPETSSETEN